jgi:hypothetical protein
MLQGPALLMHGKALIGGCQELKAGCRHERLMQFACRRLGDV